jgi:hypothetical protein
MRPSSLYYRPLLPCQSLMFPASSSPSSSSLPLERCQWPSSPSSGKTTVSIEAAESLESLIAGSFALLRIIKPRVSMGWAQHARRRQHSTARVCRYDTALLGFLAFPPFTTYTIRLRGTTTVACVGIRRMRRRSSLEIAAAMTKYVLSLATNSRLI